MLKKMKRRVNITLDMTPMVDIAFLLLIFYMATTSFKPPEKLHVSLPASHSEIKLPESDMIYVTVTKEDSVIKADKEVSYGTMNSIMNALQEIKISKFSLVTEMEMEKQPEQEI